MPAGSASINEKIRYLIRLSKEQGYLTFDDINEALPESRRQPGGHRERHLHPPEPRDRHPRSGGSRQLQAAPGGGRGGGVALLAARHPRRPGADVSQADGPGAAADPRAGGRDLQAHRGRRAATPRRPCSTLGIVSRHIVALGRETAQPRGAVRPDRHRQEDRQPRSLLQGRCPSWSRPPSGPKPRSTRRGRNTSRPAPRPTARRTLTKFKKRENAPAGQFPEVLFQAEGVRGLSRGARPTARRDPDGSTTP